MSEVFWAFLRLGLTSFGGPVAHLGYFRAEFVGVRRWLDEAAYAELVGLCQFLPGPASSQVGFAIGLRRAGWGGGAAAWAGFTLPSALLMAAFAYGGPVLLGSAIGTGVLHGLKLAAVAVVAQAVWGMARSLCPDRVRAGIGLAALVLASVLPASAQVLLIAAGAAVGWAVLRDAAATLPEVAPVAVSRRVGAACLAAFGVLLTIAFALPDGLAAAFYRSGALVFGGGHVVLPLLQDAVVTPGWVAAPVFLAGYGATQAMPGPLFTFAAFLGAAIAGPAGAAVALVSIFLPGLLLTAGVLPFWQGLRQSDAAQAAVRGANAAVVGLLAAALYDPVWTGAVVTRLDFAAAAAGFVALVVGRVPPLAVVIASAVAGAALA